MAIIVLINFNILFGVAISEELRFFTIRDAGKIGSTDGRVRSVQRGSTYLTVDDSGEIVLATSSAENKIYAFSINENHLLGIVEVGDTPKGIKISLDGRIAMVANKGSATVSVIDLKTMNVIRDILVSPVLHNIVFSPNSQYAYVTI